MGHKYPTKNRCIVYGTFAAVIPFAPIQTNVIKIIFNQFPDCHRYCQKIYLVYLNECVGFYFIIQSRVATKTWSNLAKLLSCSRWPNKDNGMYTKVDRHVGILPLHW